MDWLDIFRSTAKDVKKTVSRFYGRDVGGEVVGVGRAGDLTIRMDSVAEKVVIESLRRKVKQDFILVSEEAGEITFGEKPKHMVVCDPIDGSLNAKFRIPFFSISLALVGMGGRFSDIEFGYVENLVYEDRFYAWRKSGSFRNGVRLRGSSVDKDVDMLAIDSPNPMALRWISKAVSKVKKIRVLGCASLGLCLLASKAFDSFIYMSKEKGRAIDVAAAYLIAKEANCAVTDDAGLEIENLEVGLDSRLNLAASLNSSVHKKLLKMIV